MRFSMAILCLSLLFSIFACGPGTKPTTQNPNVLNDGSTVYGESPSDSSDSQTDGEEQVDADPTSYTDFGSDESVSSSDIDISSTFGTDINSLNWEPIYFDFDQSQVPQTALEKLNQYAQFLKQRPDVRVLLEGHCDFRGTEDYNLALGERRAQAVKRFFMELGVSADQMRTISYGELRPQSQDDNEAGWAMNRRVSFAF